MLSAVAGCGQSQRTPAPQGTGADRGIVKEIAPEFVEEADRPPKPASDSDFQLADLERIPPRSGITQSGEELPPEFQDAAGGQLHGIDLAIGMRNSVGMTMVPITHGEYVMGSPTEESGRDDDEAQVKVTLTEDFYMAATETTVGQILQWVNDPAVTLQEDWIDLKSEYGPIERRGNRYVLRGGSCIFGQSEEQPMVEISWLGADAFCKWLSKKEGREYRLPTEAEWEYCCRAGTTTAYYWGNDLSQADPYAWYSSNSGGATRPVAGKLPNVWGLYDMAGNCWEWTSDWYAAERAGGTDPRGPSSRSGRAIRGGSWRNSDLRSGIRVHGSPEDRDSILGFRVAWSPSGTRERSR